MSAASSSARSQSLGEEIANAVTHAIGMLLAVAALPILTVAAVQQGSAIGVVGVSIFGATLFLLYFASTIFHALPQGPAKRVFGILDHCAIYLLIAGTYTPIVLVALGGSWGWSMFGVIWGMAVGGIIFKAIFRLKYPMLSNLLYLVMGWTILIAIRPLIDAVPAAGLAWIVAGGLAYSLGLLFYVFDSRWRYAHFIWHLFVLAGSLCHFFAVLFYIV